MFAGGAIARKGANAPTNVPADVPANVRQHKRRERAAHLCWNVLNSVDKVRQLAYDKKNKLRGGDFMTRTKRLILAALFAALCTVCTMFTRIPSPTGGYAHAGDAMVILAGVVLGPVWGGAAAGIGSALVELIGYPMYTVPTLIIKFLMAAVAGLLYRRLRGRFMPRTACLAAGGVAEVIMMIGYFFNKIILCVLFQEGYTVLSAAVYALGSVPGNAVQGFCGIVVAVLLIPLLRRIKDVRALMDS